MSSPKIAIVYLTWNDEPKKYLARALDALSKQTYNKENLHLLVIYNSHKSEVQSQLSVIKSEIQKRQEILPTITILPQEKNLGFSLGNNLGMQWAIDNGYDYVFLHNADGFLEPNAITEMSKAFETDKNIGQVQSLIRLYPEMGLINTAGNNLNFLGVGYCSHFKEPVSSLNLPPVSDIGYASGAATMMRVDLLKKLGKWNEDFYLYHEDTEYSLRLKINNYRVVVASGASFFHEYQFTKNLKKFYWLERNRRVIKYLFFRWPTLILTWPLELVYNLGLVLVSVAQGWFLELLRVYTYWLKPASWDQWKQVRKRNFANRKLSDRQLLSHCVPTVETAELVVVRPVKALVNSVFKLYYYFLKLVVWW